VLTKTCAHVDLGVHGNVTSLGQRGDRVGTQNLVSPARLLQLANARPETRFSKPELWIDGCSSLDHRYPQDNSQLVAYFVSSVITAVAPSPQLESYELS
jgi:hypothetical protein